MYDPQKSSYPAIEEDYSIEEVKSKFFTMSAPNSSNISPPQLDYN